MKKLIILACVTTATFAHAESTIECPDSQTIGASYRQIVASADTASPQGRRVILWRQQKLTGHEYPDAGLLETWARVAQDRVQLIRYFDEHERGIEYDSDRFSMLEADRFWQEKSQLIADADVAKMTLMDTSGAGCTQVEIYVDSADGSRLEWMPMRRLVRSWVRENNQHTIRWELDEVISDPEQVRSALARRDHYGLTDYADVGDMENDPVIHELAAYGVDRKQSGGHHDH